jgi:hypothetical protein
VGEPAPAFTVTTTTGETLRLPAGTSAVLSFATAWCNPVVETAALAAIAREFGPRVAVLGVGVDPTEPLADLDAFAARFGGGYGYVHRPHRRLPGLRSHRRALPPRRLHSDNTCPAGMRAQPDPSDVE